MTPTRDEYAAQPDGALLTQCAVDTYRASGPGGQKRNKTSSAVRLRHLPTGLLVIAEESRSQHENKAKALLRLRRALYLELREPAPDGAAPAVVAVQDGEGRIAVRAKDARFWPAAGAVLDVLAHHAGQVSSAAAQLGTTTANVVAFLELDPRLWQAANRLREAAGLKGLKTKAQG